MRYLLQTVAEELQVGEAILMELLWEFFQEAEEIMIQARQFREIGDWSGLYNIIHMLKGTSASLQIQKVYENSSMLCNNLRDGNHEYVDVLMDMISAEIKDAKEDIFVSGK